MAKKKDNPVMREAARLKKEHPGMTVDEIIENIPGKKPTRWAVYKYFQAHPDEIKYNSELELPWSFGGFRDVLVNDEQWDCLLRLDQLGREKYGRYLTMRRSLWVVALYPRVYPFLEKGNPENDVIMWLVASLYTHLEQNAEIDGRKKPDTRKLDRRFLIDRDYSAISLLTAFLDVFLQPTPGDKPVKASSRLCHMKVNPQHQVIMDDFKSLLLKSADGEKNRDEIIKFVSDNIAMWPEFLSEITFSLRKNLI